jgi:hypothetical protein
MLTDFDSKRCPDFVPDYQFQICQSFDAAPDERECGFCKKSDKYYRCIAHNGTIPLSHSTIQNFITCHHLCYLQNIRGVQVRDEARSMPLKEGALWDAALTSFYGGIDRDTGKPYDIPGLIDKYQISPESVAKIRGLFRAYKMLEINIDPDFETQKKVEITIPFNKTWGNMVPVELIISGYYDRFYKDSFAENKLSGSPDWYLDTYHIQSQLGTYFLADPELKHCIMEVVRNPRLTKKSGSSPEEIGETIYQDAISRPAHYFIGWDGKTRRYGKKFFRAEFNLEEIKDRYIHIFREFWEARTFQGWYKNDKVCSNVIPGYPCDMLPLCRHNNMSESIYQIRQRVITF